MIFVSWHRGLVNGGKRNMVFIRLSSLSFQVGESIDSLIFGKRIYVLSGH
jgi:hypothetical protein